MKSISKKILIYVLCALLSVSACSCQYMRSVYAIEYVGGALAFEEALKWLLGAIGIVSAGGMTADYWENHGDDFVDYCAEQNITNAEVAEWQMKLCSGVLDKASSCWSAFKSWAVSLVGSGSSENFPTLGESGRAQDVINAMYESAGLSYRVSTSSSNLDTTVYAGILYYNLTYPEFYLITEPGTYSYDRIIGSSDFKFYRNGSRYYMPNALTRNSYSGSSFTFRTINNPSISYSDLSSKNVVFYNMPCTSYDDSFLPNISIHLGTSGSDVSYGDMAGLAGVNTENLDIIDKDTVNEEDREVAIPLPGLGVSDNEVSSDTYDDIVDAINDGTISLDDGIAQIQDLLRVIVYDDTTDEVVPYQPDPDTGDNKTKDEVIQENRNNMGFTLFGLENVFPFCIPWDIFAFLNVLKADPVAPVFNLPFPNIDDLEHPYMVRVDLSDWDDGMAIFRLAEDFLFIIGLAFLTRSLIGAGGDD